MAGSLGSTQLDNRIVCHKMPPRRRGVSRGGVGVGKMHNITVRFAAEQLQKLREIGEKDVRPVANLVNWIVAQWLEQRDCAANSQASK